MCENIRAGKWTSLVPSPCVYNQTCEYESQLLALHPIAVLIRNNEMSREVEEAIDRLNGGPVTAEKWFQYFLIIKPSISLIRYLYVNNRIRVNENAPYNLLGQYVNHPVISRFLVEEMKADVNDICPVTSYTPLISYISKVAFGGKWEEDENLCMTGLEYLLENGADPLLENKWGNSAVRWLSKERQYISPRVHDRIKALLDVYV